MATTNVPTRKLGKHGPEVTALGYGCMGLSSFYGKPRPDEERLKLLDHVYAAGVTNWDSADVYGDSEDLLGKYVSRRFLSANRICRPPVFIGTLPLKFTDHLPDF